MGNLGQANYAASKAGVQGLTLTAAKELSRWHDNGDGAAWTRWIPWIELTFETLIFYISSLSRFGIRCNCVLPGFITTPMTDKVPEKVISKVQLTHTLTLSTSKSEVLMYNLTEWQGEQKKNVDKFSGLNLKTFGQFLNVMWYPSRNRPGGPDPDVFMFYSTLSHSIYSQKKNCIYIYTKIWLLATISVNIYTFLQNVLSFLNFFLLRLS